MKRILHAFNMFEGSVYREERHGGRRPFHRLFRLVDALDIFSRGGDAFLRVLILSTCIDYLYINQRCKPSLFSTQRGDVVVRV